MEIISIWLIYHKAVLNKNSPMNFDGSSHMYGVGVVPAENESDAEEKFISFLADQKMQLEKIEKCVVYEARNFYEKTEDNDELKEVVSDALDNGVIGYACAISSEAYEFEHSEGLRNE